MADETQAMHTIRAISWREVFPFLHIFRAFRIAVHPSKLVLGLAALLTIYAGGRILDAVWPSDSLANYGEVREYETFRAAARAASFQDQAAGAREARREKYKRLLLEYGVAHNANEANAAGREFDRKSELDSQIIYQRDKALEQAAKQRDAALADAAKKNDPPVRAALERGARLAHAAEQRRAFEEANGAFRELERTLPHGIFIEFLDYEVNQINAVVGGVIGNNWAGGVLPGILNFLTVGPAWLICYHFWYFLIFAALFLVTWSLFGGAIGRIAAVHVARDEKISVRQALRFSGNKLLSFIFAPLIPLIIVLGIGAVIAAGGLLFYVPYVGPIIAGAFFFLALIASVVITLVLLGTGGGFNLMYPTIAVEGSDSFDAISRSFSYVFARPWRMLWYTAVAVAYGAVTYLFVRFFIWLVLVVSQFFVGWWLYGSAGQWYPEIWPGPTSFGKLPFEVNFQGLKFTEAAAAGLISFWAYLLIGMLGAYAISFYFSANTIIYYLMRREVDATELDDVYLEEAEDELVDAPVPVTTEPTSTSSLPADGAAALVQDGAGQPASSEGTPDRPPEQPPV